MESFNSKRLRRELHRTLFYVDIVTVLGILFVVYLLAGCLKWNVRTDGEISTSAAPVTDETTYKGPVPPPEAVIW